MCHIALQIRIMFIWIQKYKLLVMRIYNSFVRSDGTVC